MKKLDESKVKWIVAQKRKGVQTKKIAESMNVSTRWVRKLWARYHNAKPCVLQGGKDIFGGKDIPEKGRPGITYPMPMGRPVAATPGRRIHSVICSAPVRKSGGAVFLEGVIKSETGIHIPHNVIHRVLRENDGAVSHPKKGKRRKWIRYERTHSNSMWHTDYKMLKDGQWFLSYEDDASRFVTGWGVFAEATTENAIKVLEEAISKYGKPASILTDHGSQFYANESESKKKGVSEFEKKLVELDIRHILARVKHPQTNGKLERLHGEIQRKLDVFGDVAGPPGTAAPFGSGPIEPDPVARFMKHYNYERPHMSLDWDNLETPYQAFQRKMPPPDVAIEGGQAGEPHATE